MKPEEMIMTEIRRLVLALAAFAALAFAALSATSVPAQSEEIRLDALLARKLLRVGTMGDCRPVSDLNPETKAFEATDIEPPRPAHACSQ